MQPCMKFQDACTFSGPWQSFGNEERQNFLGGATSGMGFGEQLHKQPLVPAVEVGKGVVGPLS